jgi:MORN repeat
MSVESPLQQEPAAVQNTAGSTAVPVASTSTAGTLSLLGDHAIKAGYEGDMDERGFRHGYGVYRYPSGDIYEGTTALKNTQPAVV